MPIHFALLGRKRKYIKSKTTSRIIRQTNLDRRGLKPFPIICHLLDPPSFSLPTTFKYTVAAPQKTYPVHLMDSLWHKPRDQLVTGRNQCKSVFRPAGHSHSSTTVVFPGISGCTWNLVQSISVISESKVY